MTKQAVLLLALTSLAHAGTASVAAGRGETLWKHANLIDDKNAVSIQKLRLMARLHMNFAGVDEEDLGSADDYETRRLRFGYNVEFLKQFEFRNEWNSIGWDDDDFDPSISNVDTLFLSWKPSKAFNLTVGKHKAPLTQEFRSSSNELLTVERTILTQSFLPIERNWGASIRGEQGKWSYLAGVYASTFDGRYNESFDQSGANFILTSLGYDFGSPDSAWSKALVTGQYAHTDEPGQVGPKFANTVSLNFEGKAGRLTLQADALAGWGAQDAYGFYIIPAWDLTKNTQLVARYSYGNGDADTLSLRRRYEELLTKGKGDQYHTFYAGLNQYLYGHKLKWQIGAEWESMKDSKGGEGKFDGVTFETSFVFWF
jgi:phosphate-selective porin OprO and OprP